MDLAGMLEAGWGLEGAEIQQLAGGMTSRTWSIASGGRRWALKCVPAADLGGFVAGLEIAARLDRAGIPAGAPEPTRAGALVVEEDGQVAALLRWVDGEPLGGRTGRELGIIGRTLAAAHLALGDDQVGRADGGRDDGWDGGPGGTGAVPHSPMRPRIDLDRPHLGIRPWLRPAVRAACAAVEELGPETLTWGPIHGDPAPEAFRLDAAAGVCGLIDWGAALPAPRVFDLASAVMYASGPERAGPLVAAYVEAGALSGSEVERALAPMLTYRWAVQADYFAWRIAEGVVTGIAEAAENEAGLADARRGLAMAGCTPADSD